MAAPVVRWIPRDPDVRIEFLDGGDGPPVLLVHGGFSDHRSNWVHVWPLLSDSFRLLAIARRGRGGTTATTGHSIENEAMDVVALLRTLDAPACLVGHSYGAHCALLAAAAAPEHVARLVLYEPPQPGLLAPALRDALEQLATAGDWDGLATRFFGEALRVPEADLAAYRASPDWEAVLADAPATLGDLRALDRHAFDPGVPAGLAMPVLLQTGSESPPGLYLTEALAAALPSAEIGVLEGQAHEGMTTAPALYAAQLRAFLQAG